MKRPALPVSKPLLFFFRVLQVIIGISLGALSVFFIGPEMKRADASVSVHQQFAGTALVAGMYFATGVFAMRDIRASSLLAVFLSLISTPIFALLLLMSGWSMPSAEAARPLFYYIVGNFVLFFSSLWAILHIALARAWPSTR